MTLVFWNWRIAKASTASHVIGNEGTSRIVMVVKK